MDLTRHRFPTVKALSSWKPQLPVLALIWPSSCLNGGPFSTQSRREKAVAGLLLPGHTEPPTPMSGPHRMSLVSSGAATTLGTLTFLFSCLPLLNVL